MRNAAMVNINLTLNIVQISNLRGFFPKHDNFQFGNGDVYILRLNN